MPLKVKKLKKVQRTIHVTEELDIELLSMLPLTNRTYSAEIEYIIRQYLNNINKNNARAIAMASGT